MNGRPLLLSLTSPAPPGFAHDPAPPPALLRRRPFCLFSADPAALDRAARALAAHATGLVATLGPRHAFTDAGPWLRRLECPESCLGALAGWAVPMIELLERARRAEDAARAAALDGERAMKDRHTLAREYLEARAGLLKEIAERRAAEAAAVANERRFRTVVTHAPVVFFATDAEGRFTLSEGRGLSRLGLVPGQVVGLSAFDVYRDFPDICDALRRALSGVAVRTDATVAGIVFDVLYTPLEGPEGAPAGVVGVATDITERRRAEEERLALERQVLQSQKLESLGVLAGGIAHDFNNLLTAVLGNTSIVAADLPEGDPARVCLGDIEEASRRAADLCRQLLAYSGQGSFVVGPVDLAACLRGVLRLIEVSLPKGARLLLDLPENLPLVTGDATQLRQVIMNLAINAAESLGKEGGEVRLSLRGIRLDAPPEANVLADTRFEPGTFVRLEVSDTGCGMDEATLRRIFEPFFTTKFTGRGLGLSAVLGIVRSHGGALTLESEPGRGTRFRVDLPADPRAGAEAAPTGEGSAETWRGEGLVLVADDEEVIRMPARRILERLGFSVLLARDGAEAVERVRERRGEIKVVLLDLTMPVMNGVDAFRVIRTEAPALPVIAMSGFSEQSFRERFRNGERPEAFLQKPFDIAALAACLRATIRG